MKQKHFVPYNSEQGTNAVNIGRGGQAPQYENNNVVGEGSLVYTTRTGVGLGDGFTGTDYGYSSWSMSSSSSSFSSSSGESVSSSFSSSSSSFYSSSSSFSSSSFSSSSSSATVYGGAVFITNIEPQTTGNVGNKVYDEGGITLNSCITNTNSIKVSILAVTGPSHYKPNVTINGVAATLAATADPVVWTGYSNITITGSGVVEAIHEDGARDSCTVTYQAAPEVLSAVFTGGYPGTQTELKEDDTFDLIITSDIPMVGVEVQDYGAGQSSISTFGSTTSTTITVNIADRGTVTQALSIKVRVKDAYGAYGAYYDTSSGGSVDGVNVVNLNNTYPTITFGAKTYPGSQQALKGSEVATVAMTVSDSDTVLYTSPNGDLDITNPTTNETPKTVTRISGTYNISTTNLRCVGTRTANNAVTTSNTVVYIANSACTLAVTEPYTRLRSGGNSGTSAQNYTITITASQTLLSAPTLVAPVGTWQGDGFGGSGATWTRSIQIHDDDTKGTQDWGAISGTNLAGIETTAVTGDSQYVVGGFVFRTLTVAAWPNREASIGTQVLDVTKLCCTNLSKGSSGSLNFTFKTSIVDGVDKYTITEPTGIYNAAGGLWYNCDLSNAVSNSSGTMQIELEEIV